MGFLVINSWVTPPNKNVVSQYYKLIAILRRQYHILLTASWEKIYSVLGGVAKRRSPIRNIFSPNAVNINLLLTEREGRTGEYWPEVVAVRTERSEVCTKTTEGQYSPVRLEQARLVSSLLYGTLSLIGKYTSGGLHLKMFVFSIYLWNFGKNFNLLSVFW